MKRQDIINSIRILKQYHDAVVLVNRKGELIYANNKSKKLLASAGGLSELPYNLTIFLNAFILSDENHRLISREAFIKKIIKRTSPVSEELIRFTSAYTRMSNWFAVRTLSFSNSNDLVLIIFVDQTALKRKEERYRFLTYASSTLAASLHYEERIQRLANLVIENFADWCLIDTITPEGLLAKHFIAYQKNQTAVNLEQSTPSNSNILGFATKIKQTFRKGTSEIYNSVSDSFYDADIRQTNRYILISQLHIRSVVLIPLIARNKTLGVISFVRCGAKAIPYTRDDLDFFWSLATKAALLVDNTRLSSVMRRETVKAKDTARQLQENENALSLLMAVGKMGLMDWAVSNGHMKSRNVLSKFPLLPFTKGQLTYKEFIQHIDPMYRSAWNKIISKTLNTLGMFEIELRMKGQNEERFWIYIKGEVLPDGLGNPVRLIGVSLDITGRKTIEEIIRQSENKFKTIFQSSLEAIFIITETLKIRDANPTACQIFGIPYEKIITRKLSDMINTSDMLFWVNFRKSLRETGNTRGELTFTFKNAESRVYEYHAIADVLPQRHLFAAHDITERVMEEKQSKHFIAIASHELKSPLASIKAMIEILKSQNQKTSDEPLLIYLRKINGKVDTLNRIINDLLDISKIRRGKLELAYQPTRIDPLIEEVIEEIRLTAPQKIRQKLQIKKEAVIDRLRLAQVIRNLLRNAVKYSPPDSTIAVTSREVKSMAEICISDQGPGIPKEDREKIFQLYYQRQNPMMKDGLGVGLYLSSQIIKYHSGFIQYKEKRTTGSVFCIRFPFRPKQLSDIEILNSS